MLYLNKICRMAILTLILFLLRTMEIIQFKTFNLFLNQIVIKNLLLEINKIITIVLNYFLLLKINLLILSFLIV